MNWRHPCIIAMKGHPFTGKTALARELAKRLRFCIFISLDEILDTITPPLPAKPEQHHTSQAFDILCSLVETQLSLGVSVVIDSLLPSRPQLDRLVGLSTSFNATKFVIVEFQVEMEHAWRMRFEKGSHTDKWYKARNWEDVIQLINGYDKRLDEPIQGVSRLLLNVDNPVEYHHVIQVLQELIFSEGDRHLNYGECN